MSNGKVMVDLTLLAKLILVLPLIAIFLRLADAGRSLIWLKTLSRMSFGLFFWHLYALDLMDNSASRLGINDAYWWLAMRPVLLILFVAGVLLTLSRFFPRAGRYLGVDPAPVRRCLPSGLKAPTEACRSM